MTKEKIEDALIRIGVPVGNKGFEYIVDAIMILEEKGNSVSMTKTLYPEIAMKRKSTPTRVERNIRHCFKIARNRKEKYDDVNYYIGFVNLSNSNSLHLLHMMLKREKEYENQN